MPDKVLAGNCPIAYMQGWIQVWADTAPALNHANSAYFRAISANSPPRYQF